MNTPKNFNLSNYATVLLDRALVLLAPLLKVWERKFYLEYSNQPLRHQPVFIVGAPRTGSTILYQAITNQLDVLYIDNLICRCHRHFFFGFWLSNKFFRQKAHNCFNSDHGNTENGGYHAPSECGSYWYKWLPSEKHFIDHDEITDVMVEEIRKEITAVINCFERPLVFKNLNAGQRLRLLCRCFPEAKIIFMKREVIFTAQSIINAKRKIGIADNLFWSVMPKNHKELAKLHSYEQIVKQQFYIEKQIEEDRKLFDSNNFLVVNYNDLGENFEVTIDLCRTFIGTKDKEQYGKAEVKLTETLVLEADELEKFNKEIARLDWDTYSDSKTTI